MSELKPVVSIIIPVYNAACFIESTIQTVLDQTYSEWELILIDDKSTDDSIKLITPYLKRDKRIKLLKNNTNLFAGPSRNKGVDDARGRFIAFLDADDLWSPSKLKKQVSFMLEKDCAFSFTGYEFANEDGTPNGKKVNVPATISYKQLLKNTTISTITVMFDTTKLSKTEIMMPDIRSGQDMATWLSVLRHIGVAHGLNENLSFYRRSSGTLSSNKLKALRRTWGLYRNFEHLSLPVSVYNFIGYGYNAVKRRV